MKNNIIIITIFISSFAYSQTNKYKKLNINYGKGYLATHKANMHHLRHNSSDFINLSYTNYTSNYPSYGIGINYVNSGNKKNIGNIAGVYGFTDLIISKKDSSFRFKIGFGLAYIQKKYDPNKNNKNIAIGSHLNSNAVVNLEKNFIKNNHSFYIGLALTHFSNGSFQTPNLGLNFISLNAGYSIYKKGENYIKKTDRIVNKKIRFGVSYRFGIRENREALRKKYGIHTVSFYSTYSKNHRRNYTGGIDLFYNPSISFYGKNILPIRIGAYLGKEWCFNKLILGIDLGFYIIDQYKEDGISYQRLNLHYYISKNIKLSLLLKSHITVAQAFQVGISYEL